MSFWLHYILIKILLKLFVHLIKWQMCKLSASLQPLHWSNCLKKVISYLVKQSAKSENICCGQFIPPKTHYKVVLRYLFCAYSLQVSTNLLSYPLFKTTDNASNIFILLGSRDKNISLRLFSSSD